MDDETICSLLRAKPFLPFTLNAVDRTNYTISSPEQAQMSPHGGALYLLEGGEVRVVLSTRHVVSITFPDTPIIREGR
jgi:hypothetical protein